MAKLVGHVLAVAGDTTRVDASKVNPLGTRAFDDAGNEYVYCAGVASLAAGDFVVYNNATAQTNFGTIRMVATPIAGPCGIAMSAFVATQFGWVLIYGLSPAAFANIATDAAADGKILSQSATAGRAATGPVTTKDLWGAVAVGASASNVGQAFLTYPFCLGTATV